MPRSRGGRGILVASYGLVVDSVNYWRTFSRRPMPVDGPLAIEITVGGKRIGGFDASAASYTIPGPITKVRTKPGARYRILEQSPGRAVVQVRGRSFFGPIVKNYVFEISSR